MMQNSFSFTLDTKLLESLEEYSQILKRPKDIMLKEALEEYFVKVEKELLEKQMGDEQALTTLSYDEFWSGVEM